MELFTRQPSHTWDAAADARMRQIAREMQKLPRCRSGMDRNFPGIMAGRKVIVWAYRHGIAVRVPADPQEQLRWPHAPWSLRGMVPLGPERIDDWARKVREAYDYAMAGR